MSSLLIGLIIYTLHSGLSEPLVYSSYIWFLLKIVPGHVAPNLHLKKPAQNPSSILFFIEPTIVHF